MFAIEILNLVKVEQNTVCTKEISGFLNDFLNVGKRCRGGIQLVKIHARKLGNNACGSSLACAGRAVKNHIGNATSRKHTANNAALSKQMVLTNDAVKVCGAQEVGKLCVFHIVSSLFFSYLPLL